MKIIKALFLSLFISAAICALLLCAMGIVITKSRTLPTEITPLLVTAISCTGVFIGSMIASAVMKEKGMLLGILGGLIIASFTAAVSVLLLKNELNIGSAGKLITLILSGVIGGILGANKKGKVKF